MSVPETLTQFLDNPDKTIPETFLLLLIARAKLSHDDELKRLATELEIIFLAISRPAPEA